MGLSEGDVINLVGVLIAIPATGAVLWAIMTKAHCCRYFRRARAAAQPVLPLWQPMPHLPALPGITNMGWQPPGSPPALGLVAMTAPPMIAPHLVASPTSTGVPFPPPPPAAATTPCPPLQQSPGVFQRLYATWSRLFGGRRHYPPAVELVPIISGWASRNRPQCQFIQVLQEGQTIEEAHRAYVEHMNHMAYLHQIYPRSGADNPHDASGGYDSRGVSGCWDDQADYMANADPTGRWRHPYHNRTFSGRSIESTAT